MNTFAHEFLRKDRPWLIISGGLFLFTLYDIYDHISRPGSTFEANPFLWGLFSLCSLVTIIAVMFLIAFALNKVVEGFDIAKEIVGLFVAVSCHILLTGPLYNKIFWSADRLLFQFNIGPILILCGIYLFFRIAVFNGVRYFLKRKKGIA